MNRDYGIQNRSINAMLESKVNTRRRPKSDPLKFKAGRGFDDEQMRTKPAVLVPLFGLPEDQVSNVCRFLYQCQQMTMEFRPVLYTDMNVLSVCRPYGWIVEHHMSEYDAAVLGCWSSWEESIVQHAQYIVDFFNVDHILLPDYSEGLESFTRRLCEIAKTRIPMHAPIEPSSVSRIEGWRSWASGPHRPSRLYNVKGYGGAQIRVEISGGTNENLLIVDGPIESDSAKQFIEAAKAREWPLIRVDSLGVLDRVELEIAVKSLVSMCNEEGTVVLFGDETLAPQIASIVTDERIELRRSDSGDPLAGSGRELSMADIELKTTIRRASSAFVR